MEITNEKQTIVLSDNYLDSKDDIYAFLEFGKIVNRCELKYNNILSSYFWEYIKEKYNIDNKNSIVYSWVFSNETIYKYIIKIEKPYKIILIFNEKESEDNEIAKNDTISNLTIYYNHDSSLSVEKIINDLKK